MDFKRFIGIPILVAGLAFSFIVLDQLLSPYMPIPGNKGFGWVTFQAWALYFLAGCTIKGGFRTFLGYLVGVIMTILIIELAGISGVLGFYAFPAAAFVVVIGAISMEKVPPLDFIPAIFVGSAVMVCFMSYIPGASYTTASVTIMTYCLIGIVYGFITVKLRTAYERKVAACWLTVLLVSSLPLYAQTPARAPGAKPAQVFRAGAAISNVTPPLGEGIVGNFGTPPPATHIHDQLHARCLVLDDGESRLVIVAVDNVGISREVFDEAKRLIQEKTGLAKERMLMSSTHTHSATSASGVGAGRRGWKYGQPLDEYQTFVARRIADGVRTAMNNLEPARIGWGVGKVPQHVFNRRWKMKPGTRLVNPFGGEDQVMMNPGVGNPNLLEPAGPTDPEVSFLSVQSLQGRPIALLGNYSLHYVGGVPNQDISADYFAVFADRIQELLKADRQDPPFVAMMTNGTSGDVNNINFRGPAEKHPPYAKMRIVANDVAQEVFRVYKTVQHRNWVRLQAAQAELTLQVRQPTPEMVAYAKNVLAKPESETPVHRHEKDYAQRTLQLKAEWPEKIEVILQAFRIGDLGIASIPFETFTQTGLDIKAKSPLKPTFTIELANGNYGYLPTPEQHKLGGYETWLGTNRVEIGASRKITARLLELFATLK